jgi:hypothetical protein
VKFAVVVAALLGLGGGCSAGEARPAAADAAIGPRNDAPPMHGGTALDHVLFVNTEGVDLHPGAEDATLNVSSIISAPETARPFAATSGDRADQIAAIVGEAQAILAPYDIEVVTVRPATGPYHQIVLTDSHPQELGLPVGVFALAPSAGCTPVASEIGLVFAQEAGQGVHLEAENIVAIFGGISLIPLVTKAGDCMCFASSSCAALTAACTIGGAGTALDTEHDQCHGAGPDVDEAAVWLSTFGSYR